VIDADLAELARRWGVQTGYWDVGGTWHDAGVDGLVAVLAELGAPIDGPAGAADAVTAHDRSLVSAPVEPVMCAPAGEPLAFELRLPTIADGLVAVTVVTEDGDELRGEVSLAACEPYRHVELDGRTWAVRWITTQLHLPVGYHQATVEAGGGTSHATVLAPPAAMPALDGPPIWGLFAPTYSFVPTGTPGLEHLGIGHLGDLRRLAAESDRFGGKVVSTLPLLATFLDEPFEPSPYSPVSRRWWGELHLDPRHLPGLDESPKARELLGSRRIERAAADLAGQPLIDHREAARLVREVVDALVGDLPAGGPTAAAVDRFAGDRPELDRYARFRALVERHGDGWGAARAARPGPDVDPSDIDAAAVARHRYLQYAAETQVAQLAAECAERGQFLALDLPLGANPDGFDVWANHTDFATGMATGAPPDDFFSGGQDWGFPPLHPIASRARGHEELKLAVRHHVRHTGLLRIDHLMSLERLWWIPQGHGATEGLYVRYPTNELTAVIAIEATRAGAVVLGENLGTVTDEINQTMERWGMLGMYELQFEGWRAHEHDHVREPSRLTVAGLNTHDMPTFAGWWAGHDVVDSVDLGLVGPAEAPGRLDDRRAQAVALARVLGRELGVDVSADPEPTLAAALEWLGGTPAQIVLATLEDLWLEERPQNVPGTHRERPNWRRRFARTLEEAFADPQLVTVLEHLQRARAQLEPPPNPPPEERP
jgi:4-alpha-glucanotransferase